MSRWDGMDTPVTIKLLTLWCLDNDYLPRKPKKYMCTHGLWETYAVQIIEENGFKHRVYSLRCILPYHPERKVGDTCRMYEGVILGLCHPVTITHLPKLTEA